MKRDKKSNEKRTKARQEARPKKVMELFSWIIKALSTALVKQG